MSEKSLQEQINKLDSKLDLLIEEVTIQRQNREAINDLIDDVAVIGKDAFSNVVVELDNAGIELNRDALKCLTLRLIRNIENMGMVVEMLESISDLTKDLTPVVKQIGLDGINKFHDLEQKGYFTILNQIGIAMDKIASRYSKEDLDKLSGNLVQVFDTLSVVSDERVLEKINAIFSTLRDIKTEDVKEFSVWRVIRDLNKPEFRKSIGFMMAFLEIINNRTEKN